QTIDSSPVACFLARTAFCERSVALYFLIEITAWSLSDCTGPIIEMENLDKTAIRHGGRQDSREAVNSDAGIGSADP
ncbi:uncharacterized, partial [Tachysurus ichikawai]